MQGEGSRLYRVRAVADEGLLADEAVIEAVAATVLSPATLVRPLARRLDAAAVTAVFRAPLAPTSSVIDEAKGQLAGELGISVGRLADWPFTLTQGASRCVSQTAGTGSD